MTRFGWRACRPWIFARRGRMPPAQMPDPIWYFAFGSNMHDHVFRQLRHMEPLKTRVGRLDGYRLRFCVAGQRRGRLARMIWRINHFDQIFAGGRRPGLSAPADIVEAPGESVWGVLYLLPLAKFARLDASEGRQYTYLWADIEDEKGERIRALTFRVPYEAPEGPPSAGYLNRIAQAAEQRGLPDEYSATLQKVKTRE